MLLGFERMILEIHTDEKKPLQRNPKTDVSISKSTDAGTCGIIGEITLKQKNKIKNGYF